MGYVEHIIDNVESTSITSNSNCALVKFKALGSGWHFVQREKLEPVRGKGRRAKRMTLRGWTGRLEECIWAWGGDWEGEASGGRSAAAVAGKGGRWRVCPSDAARGQLPGRVSKGTGEQRERAVKGSKGRRVREQSEGCAAERVCERRGTVP